MSINSCSGQWSLLLTGLISAHNNVHRGTAETGTTNVLWGWPAFLAWLILTLTTTNCQHAVHLSEKYYMQCIYEGKPSPTVMASAALGECNTSRRVARRNNARVLQAVDWELVLAPFNAHGAKRPAPAEILADDAGAIRACILGVACLIIG
jgi:hypothetical protein